MPPFDLSLRLQRLPPESRDAPPALPVAVAIREARALYDLVSPKRSLFEGLPGFDVDQIAALEIVADALEEQERRWQQQRWKEREASLRPAAEEARRLIASLKATARFLLRNDEGAQAALDRMGKSRAVHILCSDLSAAANFAQKHSAVLAYDPRLRKDLPEHARELAEKLTQVRPSSEFSEALCQRNKLARLLALVVADLRAAARFALRNDPSARPLIGSSYDRRRRQRRKRK